MAGKRITNQQVKLYMKYQTTTKLSKAACAAKSGFSERSARTINQGKHHTQRPYSPRQYKTRVSSLDDVWNSVLVPMLNDNPELQPKTLMIYLQRTYLDDDGSPIYTDSHLRTLQRKVSEWKALHGSSKDVIFPQKHYPGIQALSDFTSMSSIDISINNEPLLHMLYHFRLVYSKYSYIKVILSGESFQALSEGLQEALYDIGGSPKEHRTDSLSAAYKNDRHIAKDDLTENYKELCSYYNMIPTRNNKGVSHENGSVESSHGHIKNRIKQELLLRGSSNFDTLDEYEQWLYAIVQSSNKRNAKDFKVEQQYLQRLPLNKGVDYEIKSVKVSNNSMINAKHMYYSVPSRLVGYTVTLHISQKMIIGYIGSNQAFKLERKYISECNNRYIIDYKHVIHALVRKPKAFRSCKYRDSLLPNYDFKQIWLHLNQKYDSDSADRIILRLLKLSYYHDCETKLTKLCIKLISENKQINIESIESQFNTSNPILPSTNWKQHSLKGYDNLLKVNVIGGVYATA
jgi:hypothetical protein